MSAMIMTVARCAVFLGLLPVVLAATLGFLGEINDLVLADRQAFYWGMLTYVLLHFFVAEFGGFYRIGQRLVGDIFAFFAPLGRYAPFLFPVFSVIILIFLYFSRFLAERPLWINVIGLFGVGFTFAHHIIFSARQLRENDTNIIKPVYLSGMVFVYLVNIMILALLLHLDLPKFAIGDFFEKTVDLARRYYRFIFSQFFV